MRYDILIVLYLYAFALTNLLELPIVWFLSCKIFKKPVKKALIAGVLSQLATHPLFVGVIFFTVFFLKDQAPVWLQWLNNVYLKELFLIPLIEAGVYNYFLKPEKKWHALFISYAANFVSWGLGSFFTTDWIAALMM